MSPLEMVGLATLLILILSWTAQDAWFALSPWAMLNYFIRPNVVGRFLVDTLPIVLRILSPIGMTFWFVLWAFGIPNGGISMLVVLIAGTVGTLMYRRHLASIHVD